MTRPQLRLQQGDEGRTVRFEAGPVVVEHIRTPNGRAYDFEWGGRGLYLALHDLELADTEMTGDDFDPTHELDLRGRLTLFPDGVHARGWAKNTDRENSFTALYFDQPWLLEEFESASGGNMRSLIYFRDQRLAALLSQMGKLVARGERSRLLLDGLALKVGAQLMGTFQHHPSKLSAPLLKRTSEFVAEHLAGDVSLSEIAKANGLSSYYFARSFKASTGMTPYKFLIVARIHRAVQLLQETSLPLAEIGRQVGFANPSHFSRTFRAQTGISPRQFRQNTR